MPRKKAFSHSRRRNKIILYKRTEVYQRRALQAISNARKAIKGGITDSNIKEANMWLDKHREIVRYVQKEFGHTIMTPCNIRFEELHTT